MKFEKWLDEETTTGAIALNLAKGGGQGPGVDVIGADCPDGQKWDKKKGKCVGSKLRESLSEREDIYQDLAKEIMKKHKGKKVIPAQAVQDTVVGKWAGDAPYDKYDYQGIVDILKKKGIKLKGGIK